MGTKNQSYSMDEEVVYKLSVFASSENISKSRAVNKILKRFLNVEVDISLADTPYEKKVMPVRKEQTEEERLADWEWRKGMVEQGKFPVNMADEYPQEQEGPPVYLDAPKTDEQVQIENKKIMNEEIEKEKAKEFERKKKDEPETQEEMENREFDESVQASLEEKE